MEVKAPKNIYGSGKGSIYKKYDLSFPYYIINYDGYNWCKRYSYRDARVCYSRMVKGLFVEHCK